MNKLDQRNENWRKALTERGRTILDALREWRKTRASEERIPACLVSKNGQLTRMPVGTADSLAALGRIAGNGTAGASV